MEGSTVGFDRLFASSAWPRNVPGSGVCSQMCPLASRLTALDYARVRWLKIPKRISIISCLTRPSWDRFVCCDLSRVVVVVSVCNGVSVVLVCGVYVVVVVVV